MTATTDLPVLSVVVVNYRGADDTITCLKALRDDLDHPADKLEVVCVDNASGDDSAALIREFLADPFPFPVRFIESEVNTGFCGGHNLGAAHATGEIVAFLNNDARPHQDWARTAIQLFQGDPQIGAVASKVLDWEGVGVDYVDGALTWYGMGYKPHAGRAVQTLPDAGVEASRDVLFGTGSALFFRRELFAELGGFDERFFMFYEDVDLGWRANLRGWRVRYEPRSIAYHRHHAAVAKVDNSDHSREYYLLERNALAALYKNCSDATLVKALPGALALSVRRATARGGLTPEIMETPVEAGSSATVPVPPAAMAGLLAIDQFVDLLPSLLESRVAEQSARVRSDHELLPLMRKALEPAYPLERYLEAHRILTEALELTSLFGSPRRVVVVTDDRLDDQESRLASRAWHVARVLCGEHDVRLVTVDDGSRPDSADLFPVIAAPPARLREHLAQAEIVVLTGWGPHVRQAVRDVDASVAVAWDVPRCAPAADPDVDAVAVRTDFAICATSALQAFWDGRFAASTPRSTSVLEVPQVVPDGLPTGGSYSERPDPTALPGVTRTDRVAVWSSSFALPGNLSQLVRAVGLLRDRRPDLRLVAVGNADSDVIVKARAQAEELGLLDAHVHFVDVSGHPAAGRAWAQSADCVVALGTPRDAHDTTAFSDLLAYCAPLVVSGNAELVEPAGLGVVVAADDPAAVAAGLEKALYDSEFAESAKRRVAVVRARFAWEETLRPLLAFCREFRATGDGRPRAAGPRPTGRVQRNWEALTTNLAERGLKDTLRRAAGRAYRQVRRTQP